MNVHGIIFFFKFLVRQLQMINNPGLSPRIYQVLSDEKLCLTDNPIYMQLLTTFSETTAVQN